MTTKPTPEQAALGTLQEEGGKRVLRLERGWIIPSSGCGQRSPSPSRLRAGWPRPTSSELVEGGRVVLRWLNSANRDEWERYDVILPDDFDPEAEDIVRGTVTAVEPPSVLEFDTDRFGTLRWELREEGSGCVLTFTSGLPEEFPEEMAAQTLAGWHSHLDLLADALAGRPVVDWSKQSLDEWAQLRDRYAETLR